jgi:hypothetical protein
MSGVAWLGAVVGLAMCTVAAQGQERAALPPSETEVVGATASAAAPATPEEAIEQLVAPIALYPDALVSQILMASTYPLEVVQAERWVKANPGVTGDALATALNEQTWDPSVKSLTGFPDVLTMMSEKLDWTTKLGDAFLEDQKRVLDAIQTLRGRAKTQGNLETTSQQIVNVESGGGTEVIVIESADPQVIYVPQYDPVVVYGGWPYPSYPPYSYYPPGYVAGTAALSFGVGLACGAAWGHAWGDCDWNGGDVDIDIDRNTNFNTNIDRSKYKNEMNARGQGQGKGQWQHDSSHRQGVAYRDNATAQKYGKGSDARAAQSREQYRGRAEAGQRDLARDGGASARDRSGTGANRSGTGSDRAANTGGSRDRSAGAADRSSGSRSGGSAGSGSRSGSKSSGFSSGGKSSGSTRAASSRGSSSRSASGGSRSGGSRSGGGSRGGGGRGR